MNYEYPFGQTYTSLVSVSSYVKSVAVSNVDPSAVMLSSTL